MSVADEIMAAAQALEPDIVADRRLIHSQPENGYQELKNRCFGSGPAAISGSCAEEGGCHPSAKSE